MSKIKLAHISPMATIEQAHKFSQINLVLAHLIDKVPGYAEFYFDSPKPTIMDNGAFELGEPYEPEKLIELARKVDAKYIVLPDYPEQPWEKTVEAAKEYIPVFKEAGFKTFYVPQSEKGDKEGYFKSWQWALHNKDIDLIGCSILGAPNAYPDSHRISARYEVLSQLANVYDEVLVKRIHMLGMLDTVQEIALVKPFHWMINSWDTSAATWYGIHNKDVSETYVKFRKPVEFHIGDVSANAHRNVMANLTYINSLR